MKVSPATHPNIVVTLAEILENTKQLKVFPPLWHPLVWWPNSHIDKEDIAEFVDDSQFPNPSNLDAAVDWHRDKEKFYQRQSKISSIIENSEDCVVCLDDCHGDAIQFTCFDFHWCCNQCASRVDACPMCRFIPIEKRNHPLAAYK